jgi:hypothetical protein
MPYTRQEQTQLMSLPLLPPLQSSALLLPGILSLLADQFNAVS